MTRRHDEFVPFSVVFGLPTEVGLRVAAKALGLSPTTAYRRIRRGDFPCALRKAGRTYVVRMPDLMRALGIQDVRVHHDDIEAGARFSAGMTDD
ncbi:helix-turn-helix transcriptional regulator [Kitasatospora sp. NPDC015120]|uniref:helix-turn-helix transcriptional regulator n=1 Tax=Kitasatospora sp. NPDC015120 TaxID=3364023 RepID=UPI0036F4559D